MNKAEDRYLEHFLDGRLRNCSSRDAFLYGYHQAEKDLALTWENIREICTQSVLVEIDLGRLVSDERHYTEVLNRFNKQKGK